MTNFYDGDIEEPIKKKTGVYTLRCCNIILASMLLAFGVSLLCLNFFSVGIDKLIELNYESLALTIVASITIIGTLISYCWFSCCYWDSKDFYEQLTTLMETYNLATGEIELVKYRDYKTEETVWIYVKNIWREGKVRDIHQGYVFIKYSNDQKKGQYEWFPRNSDRVRIEEPDQFTETPEEFRETEPKRFTPGDLQSIRRRSSAKRRMKVTEHAAKDFAHQFFLRFAEGDSTMNLDQFTYACKKIRPKMNLDQVSDIFSYIHDEEGQDSEDVVDDEDSVKGLPLEKQEMVEHELAACLDLVSNGKHPGNVQYFCESLLTYLQGLELELLFLQSEENSICDATKLLRL